jgi:hypothetical protein
MPIPKGPPADFLTSKQEIITYLGCTEDKFWDYIKQGMPALYINSRWSASIKAIENWWFMSRNNSMKPILDKVMQEDFGTK